MESVKEKAIDKITGIYLVKPVRSTYLSQYDKNHNGAVMFDRAVFSYAVERDPSTGLVVTGLTDQEARELELEMGYKVGSLSPYNFKIPAKDSGDFSWGTYSIKIPKEGLVINADNSAKEKLMLKVLMAGSRVATSTLELSLKPSIYELLLTSTEDEAKIVKQQQSLKKKAYAKFATMSLEDMIDFLSVYDEGKHKVSKSATTDFIEAEVGKIVDKEPEKFLDTVESDYYKTMIFLFKCLNAQLVYKQGSKYLLAAGGDIIGNTLLEAVLNLQSEDYQGIKISLISKLESK
jgi:hypothetical protein